MENYSNEKKIASFDSNVDSLLDIIKEINITEFNLTTHLADIIKEIDKSTCDSTNSKKVFAFLSPIKETNLLNIFLDRLRNTIHKDDFVVVTLINDILRKLQVLNPSRIISLTEKLLFNSMMLLFNYDYSGKENDQHGDLLIQVCKEDYDFLTKNNNKLNTNEENYVYTNKFLIGTKIIGEIASDNLSFEEVPLLTSNIVKDDQKYFIILRLEYDFNFFYNYTYLHNNNTFLIAPGTKFKPMRIPNKENKEEIFSKDLTKDNNKVNFVLDNVYYNELPQIVYDLHIIENKVIYSKPNVNIPEKNLYYFLKLLFRKKEEELYEKALILIEISLNYYYQSAFVEFEKYSNIGLELFKELRNKAYNEDLILKNLDKKQSKILFFTQYFNSISALSNKLESSESYKEDILKLLKEVYNDYINKNKEYYYAEYMEYTIKYCELAKHANKSKEYFKLEIAVSEELDRMINRYPEFRTSLLINKAYIYNNKGRLYFPKDMERFKFGVSKAWEIWSAYLYSKFYIVYCINFSLIFSQSEKENESRLEIFNKGLKYQLTYYPQNYYLSRLYLNEMYFMKCDSSPEYLKLLNEFYSYANDLVDSQFKFIKMHNYYDLLGGYNLFTNNYSTAIEEYLKSIDYYNKAYANSLEISDSAILLTLYNLSVCYCNLNDMKEIEYCDKALDYAGIIYKNMDLRYMIEADLYLLGYNYYINKNNHEKAEKYALNLISFAYDYIKIFDYNLDKTVEYLCEISDKSGEYDKTLSDKLVECCSIIVG